MTTTKTVDRKATVIQILLLKQAGCDRIRCAVSTIEVTKAYTTCCRHLDIYFDSKLAMESIRQGADKIRMNPSNIGSIERIKAVVEEAKTYRNDRNVHQKNLQSPIPAS